MDHNKENLREGIARIQHEIWAHWMEYLFSKAEKNEDGSYIIPEILASRWQRQVQTPYNELPENEKESDREIADWILRVYSLHKK